MYKNTIYKSVDTLLKLSLITLIGLQQTIYSMQAPELDQLIGTSSSSNNANKGKPTSYMDPEAFYKIPNKPLSQMVGPLPPLIQDLIYNLNESEGAAMRKMEPNDNLILYGPPGTGKTSIAECVATETGRMFYTLAGSTVINSFQGSGGQTITKLFEHIKNSSVPTVVFIDEVDVLINNKQNENIEASSAKINLQREIDKRDPKIICLLATNYIEKIHNEVLSRCEKVHVPLPTESTRFELLKHYSKNKNHMVSDIFFKKLAAKTKGLSCRDIERIVRKASKVEFRRNKASITETTINEEDYTTAASQYISNNLKFNERKALFKHYMSYQRLQIELTSDMLDLLAKETEDFSSSDVESAVSSIADLIKLNNGQITKDILYSGVYYNQKTKIAPKDIREKIIKCFFRNYNSQLDQETYKDLVKYTEQEDFTGEELKEVINSAKHFSEKRDSDTISPEDAYLGLYMELKKKAVASEVTKNIYTEVKNRWNISSSLGANLSTCTSFGGKLSNPININIGPSAGFNWSPAWLDSKEETKNIDVRMLAQNEKFLKKTSLGDKITKTTRLDYVNKNLPDGRARSALIKYFLNEISHKLTNNEIIEFVIQSEGLSWYSIEEAIKASFSMACKIDGIYVIEYKHLRYMLYTHYDILLSENPNKLYDNNLK